MSVWGQSRHSDHAPLTSGLPRIADIFTFRRHVSNVPTHKLRHGPIHSMTASARARHGPAQGDATVNYRLSDSPPIHPVARSILRTGTPEPHIKLSRLRMGVQNREIKMKKIIVLVSFICALGIFASHPSVDSPRQAAMETLSPLAMMQASRWLPPEAYDAF